METYENWRIDNIIKMAKKRPDLYLSYLKNGALVHELNEYFVGLYDRFKSCELRDGFNVGDIYSLLSVDPNFNAEVIYGPWARGPWVRNNFIEMLNDYWKGPQVLDIQLGGACNYKCCYCDSDKCRVLINAVDLKLVKELIKRNPIKQIYICGLGEPTVKPNISKLKEILQMAEANDIKVSMFTNLSNMDELFKYLSNGTLNILYKHDTNDIDKMQKIYGCSPIDVQRMQDNRRTIESLVCYDSKNRTTNIGASIVPTKENIDEIPDIIKNCFEKKIYPFLGGLEESGRAAIDAVWKELAVTNKEAVEQIIQIMREHGIYEIDMCPAAVLSIHITNMNFAVTDRTTGSSCPWNTLKTPEYRAFAFLPEGINDLWFKLGALREASLPNNIDPWLRELISLGVAPNIIDGLKKDPTEIIKYFGVLCLAQHLPEDDINEIGGGGGKPAVGGCGGDPKALRKVISLSSLGMMARARRNFPQYR